MNDRAILITGAFVRAVAIGFTAVVLGLHLAAALHVPLDYGIG